MKQEPKMKTFDADTFEIKFKIADAATDLYIKNNGTFYVKDAAKKADIDPAEVFNYFPNKESILQFYYDALILQYESMIDEIEDFEQYSISEKFTNFAYTSFDILQQKRPFVEGTFNELVLCSYRQTDFEKEIDHLVKRFIADDPHISLSSSMALNDYFYALLRKQYLQLVKFWLDDESEKQELTIELTDKSAALLQELLYNSLIDRGLDIARFLAANRKAFLKKIPIVQSLLNKIEVR